MTHLLDSDHVSILDYPAGAAYAAVIANMGRHPAGRVGVSAAGVHEQVLGCNTAIAQARTRDELVEGYRRLQPAVVTYAKYPMAAFDAPAAAVFDALRAAKVRIGTIDLRIAATALANDLTVVTRNVRDFGKVPGLRTEDWTR